LPNAGDGVEVNGSTNTIGDNTNDTRVSWGTGRAINVIAYNDNGGRGIAVTGGAGNTFQDNSKI
jgi:hypothetical protein